MADPNNQETGSGKTTAPSENGFKKRFRIPLRIIIVIFAVVFAVFGFMHFISRPYDKTHTTYKNVTVETGDKLEDVAQKLEENGIVADASRFALVSRLTRNTEFKPGTYFLSPSMNSVDIAKTMVKGITTSSGFTIPAGYTLDQVATVLDRDGFVKKDDFLRIAASPVFQEIDFIGDDVKGRDQIEGFLFPGSYTVSAGMDETMIIINMLDSFNNFFNEDYRARAEELGMSIREVIVVASMIENETSNDKEKAMISGVIHNRINLEMNDGKEIPEVPLCSPGEASIIAALYPEEHEYTYYVLSDKLDGTHVFTSDKEEYKEMTEAYEKAVSERNESREAEASEEQEDS